jgi:hypothetical protein
MARTLTRLLVTPLVVPHELAHALPARLAGLAVEVSVLPDWAGAEVPLGQFNADLGPGTPLWLIRLIAVAPLPVHLAVAVLVGWLLPATSPLAIPLFLLVSFWASLSGGDLAVAANPRAAREAGEFLVPGSRWENLSLLVIPATAVAVGLFVLR